MDEAAVKAEMRLWALEKIVCDMLVTTLSSHPNPMIFLSQMRAQMLQGARSLPFPGFDPSRRMRRAAEWTALSFAPSQSDLLSAELEAAVDRILTMANEQMQIWLKNRS